jgi:hypothetical protein
MRRRTIEIAQLLRVVTDAAVKAVESEVVATASEPQFGELVTRVIEAVPAA